MQQETDVRRGGPSGRRVPAGDGGGREVRPSRRNLRRARRRLERRRRGEGAAKFSDGSSTPLRCHASYAVSGGGDHLDQALDCSSPRQAFAFRIELDQTNGAILGNWRELTRQVQGGVSGAGGPGRFELAARGQGFSAQASVVTRGARQSLTIATAGGEFASASIVLRRGR